MTLFEAVIGAILVLVLCLAFGWFFGFIYMVALHLMHNAPEAIFVPYYVLAFIGIVLVIYFSNKKSSKQNKG